MKKSIFTFFLVTFLLVSGSFLATASNASFIEQTNFYANDEEPEPFPTTVKP